jgi:putative molybdopterin biosynthesis protein
MTLDQVRSALASAIPKTIPTQDVNLENSVGSYLAEDTVSTIDVPGFDRATMDGFAVKAQDTFGANEVIPKSLKLIGGVEPGEVPGFVIGEEEASEIATGAALPIGSNAVVMVEYTKASEGKVEILSAVTPGENVMAAGSDIMSGELLLRRGQLITSREVGVLAALGKKTVNVLGSPRVAIISTGNELVPPGSILRSAKIFDINACALSAAVQECGGTPIMFGIAADDEDSIQNLLRRALGEVDLVLTSGSTSAGRKDLLPKIISSLEGCQVIANGLAIKPGKPALVAAVLGKPLFALPGNPTSALMVFHSVVKPTIRILAGMSSETKEPSIEAKLAFKTFSVRGRQELLPVHLVADESGRYLAYPTLSGSGAVTSFALADGFLKIPADRDIMAKGETVQVQLFSPNIELPDLVIIGSHCIGIDILLRVISKKRTRFSAKTINVGSVGGLHAVKKGEADLGGIHLLDERSGDYNIPFIKRYALEERTVLIRGYSREQGLIVQKGNPKSIHTFEDLLRPGITFINRNAGSGTRILIDMHLAAAARKKGTPIEQLTEKIVGYDVEAKSHGAVASAVSQGRVDVGFGIRTVAEQQGLEFIQYGNERFDFLVSRNRMDKPSVALFLNTLRSDEFKRSLKNEAPGLRPDNNTGNPVTLN